MGLKTLSLTAAIVALAVPASANQAPPGTPAPTGAPTTLYCLWTDPITGSFLKRVECATREEWADDSDVDLDREWARNGVRVEPCEQPNQALCPDR